LIKKILRSLRTRRLCGESGFPLFFAAIDRSMLGSIS
jgi:hypothetical protein